MRHKQRLYAENRAAGLPKKAAALAAGVPPTSASSSASRYERNPTDMAHMKRLGFDPDAPISEAKKTRQPAAAIAAQRIAERSKVVSNKEFTCPLAYMRHLMNEAMEDPKIRLEAAKSLASFTVTKASEKGIKEQRQDKAEKVIRAQRFGASKPPLKIVT